MDDWLWWILAALLLFGVEMLSLDLIFLMLGIGALSSAVAAAVGAPLVWQAVVGAVVALLLIFLVRPVAIRHLHPSRETRTGTAALIGAHGLVLERIDAHDGRVRLAGEIWSARSNDPTRAYEPGDTVEVSRIEGATAVVGATDISSTEKGTP